MNADNKNQPIQQQPAAEQIEKPKKVSGKSLMKIKSVFQGLNLRGNFAKLKTPLVSANGFYKTLDRKKKFIVIGAGALAAVLVIGFFCFHHTSTPQYTYNLSVAEEGGTPQASEKISGTPSADPVLLKLNHLEDQMAVMQKQQKTDSQAIQELHELNQNMSTLKNAVNTLSGGSPDSMAQIQTLVVQSNQALSGQLNSIQKTMDSLQKQSTPKHYLPPSTLPWAIQGVDVRNYQPVVVRANGFDAMQLGDVRDDWKLVDVHFDPPGAVFQSVSKPNDYVRIQ